MNPQQFLVILQARWRLIAGIVGAVAVVTLIVSLLLPKEYTASTAVLVDVKSPDPLMGVALPAMMMPGYMATQVDIVNSDRVAQRVVRMLGFEKSPELVAKWREATEGKGTVEVYYADLLTKKLDVKPSRESNVININFSGSDPKFAAGVANAFAQAYIETNIDLKVEPAKQYANWFNQRTKALREDLEKAQARLSAFQQEKGIVNVAENVDVETARLNELSAQLTQIEAQKSDSSSRQKQATAHIETNPDVINNNVIQALRTDIARLEAKLAETSGQLGKNHPQVQRQSAEIEGLKQKLGSEMAKIAGSLGAANQVNTQRESEIRASVEAQRKKILDLKKQRDELSIILRDVETAQKSYDLVTQRLSQANLESQAQQTNVVVLTPANEPVDPSKPKVLLNVALAIAIGLILGVGLAMLLEFSNRRVRSADDLTELLELPVLATLPGPTDRMRRKGGFMRASAA